jgi:hypothetical protein
MTDQPEDDEAATTEVHWSRLREDVAVVVWCSFLVASVATMLFYAFIDPLDLSEILGCPWWLPNNKTVYALGFFGFWAISAAAAGLTAYMLDTSHEHFPAEQPLAARGRNQPS